MTAPSPQPRLGDGTQADVVKGPTIGAKAKVGKIMRALKKRRPSDPIPRCHPGGPRTRLSFLNVLVGVDEIRMQRSGARPAAADVKSAAELAEVLGAMDLEKIDPDFHQTRCLPSHSLAFQLVSGGVELDPRVIEKVLDRAE